jgi:2C-methyl-D-erythritol 2,4-cyclodiphosphate synthase
VKPEAAEAQAAAARLGEIQQQFPDLQVQLDGMDKPMRLSEFLESVRREADEMRADAPDFEVAANCFLLNGG